MDCDQTHIALIERDGADEDFVDPINKAVVRRHLGRDGRVGLGYSHGYIMAGSDASLHIHQANGALKIALRQPKNVLKVEWIDYVLEVAAGTNSTALNVADLEDNLKLARSLCAKSRVGFSAKVAHELSLQFSRWLSYQ
ncbi:hypothetical protein PC114_g22041 [Phytophthora cactorum]|uniref:Uncharacterized protein n=1 Tax=Phytophthora cactorum TaxID=29920 RepID=A0A8T1BCK0_9STRA|nr:hypothetical protein PC114_g22041 [Phytophthora cactorum]KAG2900818.1 hypothetical protein PC117_g21868 [Phytophthora cactorum]